MLPPKVCPVPVHDAEGDEVFAVSFPLPFADEVEGAVRPLSACPEPVKDA
jgi:hypothetical protein